MTHKLASSQSPMVANQPHIVSITNKTPKGRRRIRAMLGVPNTETVSPGMVRDAREKACSRTIREAQRTHATQ